jgi:fatty-acyl-CoA synthase
MREQVYSCPTVGSQTLAALRRFPERTAFAWDGGSITYRGTLELIARMQAVFIRARLGEGSRVCARFRVRRSGSDAAERRVACIR